jgi:DNA-binding GntR family transcriptional regulator
LQRLVADQIARDLGTSVIPVREALRLLESEGLVESQAFAGARVAGVSEAEQEELLEIRMAMEPLLAKTAVAGVTPAALIELEATCEAMEAAVQGGDLSEYSRNNYLFHDRLYQLSPWKTMYQMVVSAWERSRRIRLGASMGPEELAEVLVEHRAMVDALRARDGKSLEELARRHRQRGVRRYLNLLRQTTRVRNP